MNRLKLSEDLRPFSDLEAQPAEVVEQPADGTPFPGPDALKKQIDALDGWADGIKKRRRK